MQTSYGVVWRDGEDDGLTGKLELLPQGLHFEGRSGSRDVPYAQIDGIHVGRARTERVNGRPSVVLERKNRDDVSITAVAQSSLLSEIVERLTQLQLGAQRRRCLVVVLPLEPGSSEAVGALLDEGPPFDPSQIEGLDRHEVFLTAEEVVFLFEANGGTDCVARLLAQPEIWSAAAAWREHLAGPPRIAEAGFSWSRAQEGANVYYLPTPGPGDSDGGDIF